MACRFCRFSWRLDLPNVVVVKSGTGSEWMGNISEFNQYRSLLEWAARSVNVGHLPELPREFKEHLDQGVEQFCKGFTPF